MQKHTVKHLNILFVSLCMIALLSIGTIAFHLKDANMTSLVIPFLALILCIFPLFVIYIKDKITAAADEKQLKQQAYTDEMTQVKNRAAFNLITEQLDAASYPHLSLLMADLNNLKQVNDTLGHPAGDQLIRALVSYLKKAFGHMGTIYRYGGDEFVVLIEDSSAEELRAARASFDKMIYEHSANGGLEIFVAIGTASRNDPSNANLHVMELLILADSSMYQSKASQKAARASYQPVRHQWLEQIDASTGILTFTSFKNRLYSVLSSNILQSPCIINFDLNFSDNHNYLFRWDAGSQLLQKMTSLALSLCGENGFCAHAEADSFWVFTNFATLDLLTERIKQQTALFQRQLGDFVLYPRFGIYQITNRMSPVNDMCTRAACAKHDIEGRLDVIYNIFSSEDHLHRIDNMRLTSYIQCGLKKSEFVPYFQPKYSADGRKIVGAEALTRWLQANESFLLPDEFIALYESSGLILSLDWHILDQVCLFQRKLMDSGVDCVPVSINFSRLHVYESSCAERISRIAAEHQVPPHLIQIELTETALIQNFDQIHRLISSIREAGFAVSLDGFGNGLSSLALLKKLTVDSIKIDQALTADSTDNEIGTSILSHIIAMCRQLGITTIAECVETQEQLDLLYQCGCDMVQGRFLASPLPEKKFELLLRSNQKSGAKISTGIQSTQP